MDKQTSIAANSPDRAKMIAELKKPSPKWPATAIFLLAFIFVNFLVSPTTETKWVSHVLLSGCFLGAIALLLELIGRLQKRVEALTSLLLEQQDR